MYRVTPIFEGDNLVASGVLMEAKSVEDEGDGVLFCVYVYNVQPGVTIDYATGKSELAEDGNTGSSSSGSTAGSGKNDRFIECWKQLIRSLRQFWKIKYKRLWNGERNLYPQHQDHEIPPPRLRFCEEY